MKNQIIFLSTVVLTTIIPARIDAQWGTSTFQNTDISRDGNVGIGFLHTSPLSDKLTIDATGLNSIGTNGLNILTGSSGYALAVHNSGGKFAIWPDGAVSIGTTSYTAGKLNVSIGSNNGSSAFHIHNSTNNKLNFSVADDGATVIGENNMVSPARLGVNGKSSNGLNIETANGVGYAMAIHNVNATPNGVFAIWPNGGVTIGNTSISTAALNVNMSTSANAIDVYNTSTGQAEFRVKSTGYVYAREINVQLTAFPDYVFQKDYKLLPLDKLETYINSEKHLPGIPTATEIQNNGANLGELNKMQMEKIEELTLYIIELEKRIHKLEKISDPVTQ
jgi:hypothetical protein